MNNSREHRKAYRYKVWARKASNGQLRLLGVFTTAVVPRGEKVSRRFLFWKWEYQPTMEVYPDLQEVLRFARKNRHPKYQDIFIEEFGLYNMDGDGWACGEYSRYIWINGRWM